MLIHDPPRDRQSKAGAWFVASFVGAEEPLENALSVLLRDARSIV
jgi:hypothetical protein